jgi:hypothetical protein
MKNIALAVLFLSLPILIISCVKTTSHPPIPTKEANPTNLSSPFPTKTFQNNSPIANNQDDQAIYSLFMDDSNGKIIIVREDTSADTYPQNEEEARNYIKSNLLKVSSSLSESKLVNLKDEPKI